uniref:Uncharacterized protein n=1 Tax=Glossina austeni TaxID=7395 RepID=A0A1A9UMY9_GLOAU
MEVTSLVIGGDVPLFRVKGGGLGQLNPFLEHQWVFNAVHNFEQEFLLSQKVFVCMSRILVSLCAINRVLSALIIHDIVGRILLVLDGILLVITILLLIAGLADVLLDIWVLTLVHSWYLVLRLIHA